MIENLKCPACGGRMVSRKNGKSGQRFWGCASYPDCRGTRDTDGEAPRDGQERDALAPSERMRENDRTRWRHQ